jgi:hypothetical protein
VIAAGRTRRNEIASRVVVRARPLPLLARSEFDAKLTREAGEDPRCHPVGVGELF